MKLIFESVYQVTLPYTDFFCGMKQLLLFLIASINLGLTAQNEEYVGTYYHLAKLYEKLDKKTEAEECYKKGMSIARKIGDNHAYNELQSAFASFNGLGDDDDEY